MTRVDLCRFVPGLSWEASGRLTWIEWETLTGLLAAARRQKNRDQISGT